VEDDLVAAARGDYLPVAPSEGTICPPAILDQPGFADSVHGAAVDDQRLTVLVGGDGDSAGDR